MHQFLTQVQSVAKDNNFFEPDFSLKEMNEIPSIYKSIIDDPATLRDRFKNAESKLKKFLVFKILLFLFVQTQENEFFSSFR